MQVAQQKNSATTPRTQPKLAETRIHLLAEAIKQQGCTETVFKEFAASQLRQDFSGKSLYAVNGLEDDWYQKTYRELDRRVYGECEAACYQAGILRWPKPAAPMYNILSGNDEIYASLVSQMKRTPAQLDAEAAETARDDAAREAFWKVYEPVRKAIESGIRAGFEEAYTILRDAQLTDPSLKQELTDADIKRFESAYRFLDSEESLVGLTPRDALVEGVLYEQSVVVATGDSNSGKTTMLQWLFLCVALGIKLGNRRTRRSKVIWFAGEDEYNAQLRIQAYMEHYKLDRADVRAQCLILPTVWSMSNPDHVAAIHQAIAQRWGTDADVGLFIFDSKSVLWGGKEENSNDENAAFVAGVKAFIQRYGGASAVLTHHLTKNSENPSARGGGALINNADTEWRFSKRPGDSTVKMNHGKIRGPSWETIPAQLSVHELTGTRYEHLRDDMGFMPSVSVVELVNTFGKSVRLAQDEHDALACLDMWDQHPSETQAEIAARLKLMRSDGRGGDARKLDARHALMVSKGWALETSIQRKGKPTKAMRLTDDGKTALDEWRLSHGTDAEAADADA